MMVDLLSGYLIWFDNLINKNCDYKTSPWICIYIQKLYIGQKKKVQRTVGKYLLGEEKDQKDFHIIFSSSIFRLMIFLPWSNIWHPVWPTISSHFHPVFGQRSKPNVLWESCPKRSNFCLIVWQNIYYYVVRSDMSEFNEFASPDRPNFLWNWQNYNLLMRQEDRRWSWWYNDTTPQR